MTPRGYFELGDVNTGMYVAIILVLIIMVYIIRKISTLSATDATINEIHKYCIINCKSDTCNYIVDKSKGAGYYLDRTGDNGTCIFTGWELSHIIFHSFIGFFFNIQTSMSIGVTWELIEHYHPDMNCGNILDIFFNTLGYTIGWGLRNIVSRI